MGHTRTSKYYQLLIFDLTALPAETEWVEFKHDNKSPEEIGEYISAIANSSALAQESHGYVVWGIEDVTHRIVGTTFKPRIERVGNEVLENWLHRLISPAMSFRFHELEIRGRSLVLLEIAAAEHQPIAFRKQEYIRVGSYKKKLKDFPERERDLWRIFESNPFETRVALADVSADETLQLLDYPAYFELTKGPLPSGRDGILNAFEQEGMISRSVDHYWNITNLGAILFARRLSDFPGLERKAVRVILYNDETRVNNAKEQVGGKGYASGFTGLIEYISNHLPENEVMGKALRKDVPMFPQLAVRELVANAVIHQDFDLAGTSPMVEIFPHRMEITNPGSSLVGADRLLGSPPRSRNEKLASFMRRIGVCEERGSGIEKVVFETEYFQLPAPIFETVEESFRAVLFAHRQFRQMDRQDRIRACYLHSCLRYVQREYMTNTSLRSRFGVKEKNIAMVSRIIRDTIDADLIRPYDSSVGARAKKYVPFWA